MRLRAALDMAQVAAEDICATTGVAVVIVAAIQTKAAKDLLHVDQIAAGIAPPAVLSLFEFCVDKMTAGRTVIKPYTPNKPGAENADSN